MSNPLDYQPGGNHYKDRVIQPIEFILANNLGFCEGNVVKYVTRWRDKNGIQDLRKAIHYLEFLINEEEKRLDKEPRGTGSTSNGDGGTGVYGCGARDRFDFGITEHSRKCSDDQSDNDGESRPEYIVFDSTNTSKS